MPETIRRQNGVRLKLDEALNSEHNVVVENWQWSQMVQTNININSRLVELKRLVALHVGVDTARVKTTRFTEWYRGRFNIAVPMIVLDAAGEKEVKRVILRCPQPAKCGEERHPGALYEKLRCEIASYIWMQQHCPDVRIPHLYGFGFPADGPHFSSASSQSIVRRVVLYIRQAVASWLRRPVPSDYVPVALPPTTQTALTTLGTGYMIIEHFDERSFGKEMPQVAFQQNFLDPANEAKTRNLFRGVSRIILALARVPQPRIGAFRFNPADATIRLDGRPTSCEMAALESEGAPHTIARDQTYSNVDQYMSDLGSFYEAQFQAAPNAALSNDDCEMQMSSMVFLRAVAHHFVGHPNEFRNGPFFLYMSDGNPTNFMVDDEWNVTGLFDLEWIIAAPVEMQDVPSWLTWDSIDQVVKKKGYDDYEPVRQAFMTVFREEEQRFDMRALEAALGGRTLSSVMEASWSSSRHWFYRSFMTMDAMTRIVDNRIQPLFTAEDPPHAYFYRLWHKDATAIKAQKLQDREDFKAAVTQLFQDPE